MALSNDLISQFVKVTKDTRKDRNEVNLYGTIAANGQVKLDGADSPTPVSSTSHNEIGDRVIVSIKNHTATVTGNLSSPSARKDVVDGLGDQITEFDIIIADKVSVKDFDAQVGRIDDLFSENVIISNKLTANEAEIGKLTADNVIIRETLIANEASIKKLQTEKLDAAIADITFATIENLNATNATIYNLEATYGQFVDLSTKRFEALDATVKNLDVEKLSAKDAELKYANIDFTNITEAAIGKIFADTGLIENIVIGNGTITGNLVGVTIKGDLIEGGTVVADKLVIKGTDGLYYKLNTDGMSIEAEQTEYNSLDGSVITAKSITATKISVKDLVAFDATIGGYNITNGSLYSGVKSSALNTTRGVYFDKEGQLSVGDASNYLRYFKDTDNTYKLELSARSIKMGANNKDVETILSEIESKADSAVISTIEEFYQSTSNTELLGGEWSAVQPEWIEGRYIWRRTFVTYADTTSVYQPSEKGVCISGNTGLQGIQGPKGDQGIPGPKGEQGDTGANGQDGLDGKTSYFHIKYSEVEKPTTPDQMTETPSTYIGTYVDFTQADSTDPNKYAWARFVGVQGEKGDQGIPGTNGSNGKTSYLHIAYANSADGKNGFSVSDPVGKLYMGQYTDFTQADSTDPTKYSWTKVKGETGAQGPQGPAGKGIKSTVITYQASASGTTPPSGSWSSNIPAVTKGQYLWSKTDITYTDNTTSTTYSVSYIPENGQNGSDGAAGPAGQGVASITQQYYLSTSKKEPTEGSWITTMPTWSTGKYLWTRYEVTYNNPDSVTHTSPICDSSWEAVNEVQVGARNLFIIKKSSAGSLKDNSISLNPAHNLRKERTSEFIPVKKGEEYVFQSWVTVDPTDTTNPFLWIAYQFYDGNKNLVGPREAKATNNKLPNGKSYDFYKITIPDGVSLIRVSARFYSDGEVKLEKGNKPTDWSPAPEDVDQAIADVDEKIKHTNATLDILDNKITGTVSEISDLGIRMSTVEQTANGLTVKLTGLESDVTGAVTDAANAKANADAAIKASEDAKKVATNYLSFTNGGLTIGNMTASNLGRNILIDTDSIDIRNGNTVLASYGENYIYLGKNSKTSVIDLCNGVGNITSSVKSGGYNLLKIDAGDGIDINTSNEIKLKTAQPSDRYSFSEFSLSTNLPWEMTSYTYSHAFISVNDGDPKATGSMSETLFLGNGNFTVDANTLISNMYGELSSGHIYITTKINYASVLIGAACGTSGGNASIALRSEEGSPIGVGTCDITANKTTVSGDLSVSGNVIIDNNSPILGKNTSGNTYEILELSEGNNCVLGYGCWQYGGNTHIYGQDIKFYPDTTRTNYIPYYKTGDTISFSSCYTAGFVADNSRMVRFSIPLSKPAVGVSSVSISSVSCKIMQNGGYKFTSGPNSYSGSLDSNNNMINMTLKYTQDTGAKTLDSCGVMYSLSVRFN